ncbi:MAG: glycine cleavage system protein GcvH [Turneriella sp.]|nr:glycine cleavage system protein GcvH [Leptospiraceae bacterium]MCX7631815.1 glycine cleavage system protein GcvH [Turneriella sp.]
MANIPQELRYTKEHEWVKIEGNRARVGITDYAQNALGDVVYIEFPKLGSEIRQMAVAGTIESVKAVSDIYQPLSGKIAAVNSDLNKNPALVNQDPYGAGWLFEIENFAESEIAALLDAAAYSAHLASLA